MKPTKPFDVGAAQVLVGARQPHQLAEVRVAAASVPLGEHRQVVVVRRDDLLAQTLERQPRRGCGEPVVPLLERAHEPLVVLRQRLRQRTLDAGEERALPGVPANVHQTVVRDADERRCEHGDERLVVVAVVQQAKVREQVDDLLLAEVPAARGPVRRQVLRPQRGLVPLGVGARGEQQHDLAR